MERFKYFISIFTIFFVLNFGLLHSNYFYADSRPKPPESIHVASFNIHYGMGSLFLLICNEVTH